MPPNANLSDDARIKVNPRFSNFTSPQTCRQKFCTYCNQTHHSGILSHSHRLTNHKFEILTPILRLHFSQLHGQENLKPGDIPMAAKIKPLSAKEIKPLLKPEEKSKVEETCETLKAKQQAETSKTLIEALDEAFQPKKTEPEPIKKSIMQRIVHEVKHYANGFKLLFVNIRISVKQFWKILNGQDLSRRERKLVSDVLTSYPKKKANLLVTLILLSLNYVHSDRAWSRIRAWVRIRIRAWSRIGAWVRIRD